MLVYEKKVDNVRHLYGNYDGNIPTANDPQLTYKDVDGDVITPVANDTYIDDGSSNGTQKIKRLSDNKVVNVFIGEHQIIGAPTEAREVKSVRVKTAPTKVTYTAGEWLELSGLVLTATYKDGDKADVTTGYTSVPADGETLTAGSAAQEYKKTVTITLGGKTCTQEITVYPALQPEQWAIDITYGSTETYEVKINNAFQLTGAYPAEHYVNATIDAANSKVLVSLTGTGQPSQEDNVTVEDVSGRTCIFKVRINGA